MRQGIRISFCFAIWMMFSANAQAQIPDIPAEHQAKAQLAGMAYLEWLILATCTKLLPGIPQIQAALDAVDKILADSNLPYDERPAIVNYVDKGWSKIELVLTTNPQIYSECLGTAQMAAAQIAMGAFNGLKP